jgi:hypothetical protein
MIKSLIGLGSNNNNNSNIVHTRFTRYMQPVINISLDPLAIDTSQSWLLEVVETETEWVVIYNMANTVAVDYFGQQYANNDTSGQVRKTKSNDLRTGWNKVLGPDSRPKPYLAPSFIDNRFDEWQAWIRTIIVEGGIWKIWWVGDSGFPPTITYPPPFSYRVGYAESHDEGLTIVNRTTTPIYVDNDMSPGESAPPDSSSGIVVLQVVRNNDIGKYVMLYAGVDPNIRGLFVAESTNGTSGWVRTVEGIFANQEYGFPSGFKYLDGVYYLWLQRHQLMPEGNLGPCREVVGFSIAGTLSADYRDWTNHGVQARLKNTAQEYGIGNHFKVFRKPNGTWAALHTYYSNRTQAIAGITKESTLGIKMSESNSTDSFMMNTSCHFAWPEYVTFHAPLDYETGYTEEISQTAGVLSSGTASYWERGFIRLNGSQTLIFPNNGNVINGAGFIIKFRIELKTGTLELFRIGNDMIISMENLKLRTRLSSDGITYQKDWITTTNMIKPAGLDYLDNHIYGGIIWDGATQTIRMFKDFPEFPIAEITKTVDNPLAVVNNSGSNILIGQNAAIEIRSVTVGNLALMGADPKNVFIELDI